MMNVYIPAGIEPIPFTDICIAWGYMKRGASIHTAALRLNVTRNDLNWWLNHYLGVPKLPAPLA